MAKLAKGRFASAVEMLDALLAVPRPIATAPVAGPAAPTPATLAPSAAGRPAPEPPGPGQTALLVALALLFALAVAAAAFFVL